jgi:hypothetical protein
MTAAHKYMDGAWLKGLSGAELLLLRLRYGKSVATAVEGELNRRASVAYGDLASVPEITTAPDAGRKRSRSSTAAA